jgi:ribulose-5-phosphate 4-epimerase/fuculose-1-phosphate aldolase
MELMDELLELSYAIHPFTICGEGNVSCRDGEALLIKASGTDLLGLQSDDLVRCGMDGKPHEDEEKKPSMEVSFHAWILKTFPQINFVAHTHPTHTNKILCSERIFSFAKRRLFPDQIVRNGTRSCVVPYATPGKPLRNTIKESIFKFMTEEKYFPKLILLQNHGIITAGAFAKDCVSSTLMCEKSAEVYSGARAMGSINYLTKEQIAEVDTSLDEKYRREI